MSESTIEQLTLHQLVDVLGDISQVQRDAELQLIELEEGELLFEEGDPGKSIYVLIAGVLGVRIKNGDGKELIIDKLARGSIVGEMAQMRDGRRTATVYAINNAGVIRVSYSKLEELKENDERISDVIETAAESRWQRLQLTSVLTNLFGDLDTASLHTIQRHLEWQHHSNGSVIFKQGEKSDGMYIVVNGRLRASVGDSDGSESVVSEIGQGETVGEFGILTGEPRTATVSVVRETNLVKISSFQFKQLVQQHPELMRRITRIIIERQQRTLKGITQDLTAAHTIAVVPASDTINVNKFAQDLKFSLEKFGTTILLNSDLFDEIYGSQGASQIEPDDPSNPAVVAKLGDLEAVNDLMIFVADSEPSTWTKRCIGQADRVLILAESDADSEIGPVESYLNEFDVPMRIELVLWHPENTVQPKGTSVWLEGRKVKTHHHIRRDDKKHMERLSRRLTGHALGLVLSGGGARGFAQFGMYRAMVELDIPIDYIGGTSFGAMLSGLFAYTPDEKELNQLADKFARSKEIFDYTLPFTSLMESRKVTEICRKIFGDTQIEDLWIPYFCVSSNLSKAKPFTHQHGPLWKAVRASISIPGVFAPVIEEGDVLVDGGVMDNFPVDKMVKLSESDRVIAVNASPHRDIKKQWAYETSISGWRILRQKLNPFGKPLQTPTLIGTILRAQEINSVYQSKTGESQADLLIYLDVHRFGFLDFKEHKAITQSGYDSALGPLREWKELRQL